MDLVGDRVISCHCVDTQLAVSSLAPSPNRTVVLERQTMIHAGRHLDNAGEVAHITGPMNLVGDRVIVVGVDTQLAIAVAPQAQTVPSLLRARVW